MNNLGKHFLCAVLAMLMVLSFVPTGAFAAEESSGQTVEVRTESELRTELAAAQAGDTIKLMDNVTVNNGIVEIAQSITLDLNTFTVTGTGNRLFRITASKEVIIQNGTIVNTANGGRCVETRTGSIDLTLNGVTLQAEKGASQPLTVGGSGTGIQIYIYNSTISAGDGYAITTFNPVEMTIENSEVSGFGALNIKDSDSSKGSAGSVFDIVGSTLASYNHHSGNTNTFATIMVEDKNVTININEDSIVSAAYEDAVQVIFGIGNATSSVIVEGLKINVANGAKLESKYLLGLYRIQSIDGNTITLPGTYAENLTAAGFFYNKNDDGTVTASSQMKPIEAPDDTQVDSIVNNQVDSIVDKIETQTPDKTLTDQEKTEIKETVKDTVDKVVEDVVKNEATADDSYKPVEEHEDVAHLEVTLEGVDVKLEDEGGEKTATVTQITYQVNPLTETGEKVSEPSKPITFRLPVPSGISGDYLEVYHEEELMGIYAIQGEGANRYVEITSGSFSAYTLKHTQEEVVAQIGNVAYKTLADALAAAKDGDEIVLLQDVTLQEDVTVSVDITFQQNGKELTGGHIYKTTVFAPGCVNGGYTEYACIVCGHTHADDEVPALGHRHEDSDNKCDRCGEVDKERYSWSELGESASNFGNSFLEACQQALRILMLLLEFPKMVASVFSSFIW